MECSATRKGCTCLQENVYYSEAPEVYVIAEIYEDTLIIDMVISDKEQDLNRIAEGFGTEICHVVLGFTPRNPQGFENYLNKRYVKNLTYLLFFILILWCFD